MTTPSFSASRRKRCVGGEDSTLGEEAETTSRRARRTPGANLALTRDHRKVERRGRNVERSTAERDQRERVPTGVLFGLENL